MNYPPYGYPPQGFPETRVVYVPVPTPAKTKSGSKRKNNIFESLEELELAEKNIKELKKRLKDEDKKDDKKDTKKQEFSKLEVFILATIASPLVFLAQAITVKYIVDYVGHMVK